MPPQLLVLTWHSLPAELSSGKPHSPANGTVQPQRSALSKVELQQTALFNDAGTEEQGIESLRHHVFQLSEPCAIDRGGIMSNKYCR